MSFDKLSKEDLLIAAELFAVEVPAEATKKDIVGALLTDGVSYKLYEEAFNKPAEEEELLVLTRPVGPKVVDPSQGILIIMERENPLYEIRGYRFTKEHPFQVVTPEDAEAIITHDVGFRQALPSEAAAYYS